MLEVFAMAVFSIGFGLLSASRIPVGLLVLISAAALVAALIGSLAVMSWTPAAWIVTGMVLMQAGYFAGGLIQSSRDRSQ